MAAQQAALGVAKKGLGMMFSASKVAAAAISAGVQKARKGYANKHETGVLNELKAKGLTPVEHIVESLKRFYYLLMAGYKHELQAAANLSAKRLTDPEKSTVPLDVVTVLGGVLYEESLKYGDFQKNQVLQGMQDVLNKTRMGKDHYDRDSIAHDLYYAVLICAEEYETEWEQMENCFREAVTRTIEWAAANEISPDARSRAAKSIFYVGQSVKNNAHQAEDKRQKNIKEAESTLRAEQQRRMSTAHSFAVDGVTLSSYGNKGLTAASPYDVNPYVDNAAAQDQNNQFTANAALPYKNGHPYTVNTALPYQNKRYNVNAVPLPAYENANAP